MSSFSLLGLVNLVGIVCAALAFLLYLRHAARRLEAREEKEEASRHPSAPAETAALPSPAAATRQMMTVPAAHGASEVPSAACQAQGEQTSRAS